MTRPVISVENLSKAYRIGLKEEVPDTLMGAAKGMFRSPLKNLRELRRLNTNRHQDDEDTLWALKDVSFHVQEGDVLGIIGRNGAGKSTLLKILSRITEPTEGRAVIRGRVSSLLEVGTGFHPELTGRDNVYMNGTILGMTKREIDRKFDEIVEFSGVEKFLDTPTKRYSSGMQVRLAFAVAAHLEPEILIIDEVLAVGDAEFQKRCLGKMKDVARGGRTVLFVSHNMAAVQSLCTRGILIEDGIVKRDGETANTVDAYFLAGRDQADGNILEEVPRIGTGEARIRRVEILSQAGHATQELLPSDPFRVRFDFEVFSEIEDAHFSVGIHSPDGIRITLSQTTDDQHPATHLCPGNHFVEASFDEINLLPREFTISVGIHRECGTSIDYIERALDFSVTRVPRGTKGHYRWSQVLGFLRHDVRWTPPPSANGRQQFMGESS